ncbi:MAG: hypothetical protein GXY41_09545 [Phycisphaerae bacterium]|nr:hypothetical protein [Phycisphaerae bacterium]
MKKWFVLSAVFIAVMSASAAIEIRVCDPNDLRPLGIDEIMMGTQVSLVVSSDANDLWSGGLFIHDAHRGRGVLRARHSGDPNDPAGSSCLLAAGDRAFVRAWNDSLMSGFDLYTDDYSRGTGNWFVLDYTPLAEGDCTLHFYDHSKSFTVADPNLPVSLQNSPTRDWNANGTVDLADYAVLASRWMAQDCREPDWCGGVDLDRDGNVGIVDLLMFADYWLWGTPNWHKPTKPSLPPPPPQNPDVFYAVVDPNGLAEVSIPVGQSIRLYLDKTTLDRDVYVFSLEVNLSDPNLGWIDHTEYDPNDLFAGGTAEILATPRSTFFDYWGPGYMQFEGIQFVAASFNGPINDGAIASFVYTPTAVGTVSLELIDHLEDNATERRSLVLHQYAVEEQQMMKSGTGEGGESMMFSTASETESISQETVDEIVLQLETIYEESPELQETINEKDWQEFIDAVKASADVERLEY